MAKKNVIIGGAVAVVVGAAALCIVASALATLKALRHPDFNRFASNKPAAAVTSKPTAAAQAPATASKPAQEQQQQAPKAAPAGPAIAPVTDDDILDAALDEQVAPRAAPAAAAAVAVTEDGVQHFPHLGLKIKPLPGWIVKEELSPMPNIAMVMVTTPELMEAQQEQTEMGAVPVIILSIEDINGENLDAVEFKERSKQMAMQQMLMMTNGMACLVSATTTH